MHRAAVQARKEASAERHIPHRPQLTARVTRSAVPGLDQFRRVDVEHSVDGLPNQRGTILRIQQLHRSLIGRHDRGIRRERNGSVVLQVHELRAGVEAEHDPILEVPQEEILSIRRADTDQRRVPTPARVEAFNVRRVFTSEPPDPE